MSHRRDKAPTDYDDLKKPSGRSQDPETRRYPDESERYGGWHDRSYRHHDYKENGRDMNHKRPVGYMRGWDNGNTHGRYYHRKEYEEHTHGNGKYRREHVEDEVERHTHHRKRDGHSEVPTTNSSRANNIVRVCPGDDDDNDRRHQARVSSGQSGYGHYDGKDDRHGHRPDVVERGRPRERSPTHSGRDESSSSGSESSSYHGTKRSRSHSSDRSQAGGKRACERSPHSSSKRKHRHRSRTRSRSGSRSSSEEREKKRKKKDKRKKDKSKKKDKDKDKDKDERRSILTGKKIKLKVKKGREDHERDANRQELLQFLNSAYE